MTSKAKHLSLITSDMSNVVPNPEISGSLGKQSPSVSKKSQLVGRSSGANWAFPHQKNLILSSNSSTTHMDQKILSQSNVQMYNGGLSQFLNQQIDMPKSTKVKVNNYPSKFKKALQEKRLSEDRLNTQQDSHHIRKVKLGNYLAEKSIKLSEQRHRSNTALMSP